MAIDLLSDKYKTYSKIVDNKFKKGIDWENIRNLNQTNEIDLQEVLNNYSEMNEILITVEEWYEIVDHVKHDKDSDVDIVIVEPSIVPAGPDHDYSLDTNYGSAWSSYKRTLFSNHFDVETVNMIEQSSHRILNKLSLDTRESGPIKGLVIGNVQSGKTANMAALMAMAADQGWNLFIILSGSIENLRIQTQDRLINDLKSATNVAWMAIDNVSTNSTDPNALAKLNLSEGAKQRYLMVCLKNSTRLKNLLTWLNKDSKNREKLKVLLIDDEADQAGINSKAKEKKSKSDPQDIERTAINQELVYCLNNKDSNGNICEKKMLALDYVAYTATPYANVLNEKPGPNSLYPADFVACLGVSNKYFGPQQIFGLESENIDGLNIINTITKDEITKIKSIYSGETSLLPNGLKDAILWFYCCFAIRKLYKDNKPVSMLIHTSQKQPDHESLASVIKRWLKSFQALKFVDECEKIYLKQTSQFTLKSFNDSYPKYGNKNIKDYPTFDSISNILLEIFNLGIKSIKIDETGEPEFGMGVHLCVDNCSHYFGENGDEHIRLIYPKKKMDYPTGFIVIGGATLSRGLTIEGLVSTYFLRTIKQADTLMQMGRWFGYRVGYELLPRIWMSSDTKEKFEFLSVMDFELRQKMKHMEDLNLKPALVGITILEYASKKLEITSKNKKKAAQMIDMDFSGFATQTTMFYSDEKILSDNFNTTSNFISKLGDTTDLTNHAKSDGCLLWTNISNDAVMEYIKTLKFPKGDSKFLDLSLYEKWYSELSRDGNLLNWNVAISGVKGKDTVNLGGYSVYKVNRSKKSESNDGIIRIGALRSPRDLYLDINKTNPNLDKNTDIKCIDSSSTSEYQNVRTHAGLNKTSFLIIYVIDKNSKPLDSQGNRIPMGTANDVIGIMIIMPEQNEGKKKQGHIGIDLSSFEYEESEE